MPWTENVAIPNQLSHQATAMAAYDGDLHLVHPGDSSHAIWWSSSGDGTTWSPNTQIPGQLSKGPSALAVFGGRLHLVHQGDSSNQLWHSSFDGVRWTTNAQIPGESSSAPVALAAYGGLLHCLHIGSSSHRLYHLTFDGVRWTKRGPDAGLDAQRSKGAPALAAYGGLLHQVHQGDSSDQLWHSTFDGTTWSFNTPIANQLSKAPAALADFGGLLHMVHLGESSNRLWHSTFDGTSWQPNIAIPDQLSKASASLAAFGGRLHMTHLGDTSNAIWHSTSDGVLVRHPARRVVLLDIDGLRWDTFQAHLVKVRDAGASTTAGYRFELGDGASDDTILGDGGQQLNSAFAELCFGAGNGMVDVRLALAGYPSFTFPSHASMYTGTWPGRHGVTGNTFLVRDAPPEWDLHAWESMPRAASLQGYCTDASGDFDVFLDYIWGGLDEVGEDGCVGRQLGLVSDLRVPTLFDRVHDAGLRSTSINSFYHGAREPWTALGRDRWWHFDRSELRSIKDICSDADVDQYEFIDHSALVKARLALRFRPSSVRVRSTTPLPVGAAASGLSGDWTPQLTITGDAHPDGIPDLLGIYLASIDEASHVDGRRNQATYLAWFDHRLAGFVRDLRSADPDVWDRTVFALVADHGHASIATAGDTSGLPASNAQVVREELVRIILGDQPGDDLIDQLHQVGDQYGLYGDLLVSVLKTRAHAWEEAMNLYVYLREPATVDPVQTASRLLSRAMRTEPYGALVLVGDEYQFLARGEARVVPLTSAAARRVIVPQLDPPPRATADIAAVSLSPADVIAETQLRDLLASDAAYDVLRVADRVAGLNPLGNRSMPDVILLAPAGRSFTSPKSNHGSFDHSTGRIPMVFFGPGMPEGRVTLTEARMVDFAPTVLSLLGVGARDMDGAALLDLDGHPTRTPSVAPRPPRPPSRPPRWRVRPREAPIEATLLLQPSAVRPATEAEWAEASAPPVLVSVSAEARRAERRLDRGTRLHARSGEALVLPTALEPVIVIDGNRRRVNPGERVPLTRGRRLGAGEPDTAGAYDISPDYLLQPVRLLLPVIPDWLGLALHQFSLESRLWLTDERIPGPLVTGRRFARWVEAIDRATAPEDPVGPRRPGGGRLPPGRGRPEVGRRGSEVAAVAGALEVLDAILRRGTIARLSLASSLVRS